MDFHGIKLDAEEHREKAMGKGQKATDRLGDALGKFQDFANGTKSQELKSAYKDLERVFRKLQGVAEAYDKETGGGGTSPRALAIQAVLKHPKNKTPEATLKKAWTLPRLQKWLANADKPDPREGKLIAEAQKWLKESNSLFGKLNTAKAMDWDGDSKTRAAVKKLERKMEIADDKFEKASNELDRMGSKKAAKLGLLD